LLQFKYFVKLFKVRVQGAEWVLHGITLRNFEDHSGSGTFPILAGVRGQRENGSI
jgi:hypothetical protein